MERCGDHRPRRIIFTSPLAGWRRAVEQHQLDIDYYVNRRWDTGDKLPWGMIDSGMRYERLCGELEKALAIA